MRIGIYLTLAALLGSACLFGDDDAERAKLIGSWRADAPALQWSFSYTTTSVKVTENDGGNTIADFACTVDSKPCDIKIGGKKASVSFWFNGGILIEMETLGKDTVQRRFAVDSGDALKIEVVPMEGRGKHETLQYKRAPAVTAQK
jgi:hypothetical protein